MEIENKAKQISAPNNLEIVLWVASGFLVVLVFNLVFEFESVALLLGATLLTLLTIFYFDLAWALMIVLLAFSLEIGGEEGAAGIGLTLPTEPLIVLLFVAFVIRTVFRLGFQYTVSPLNPPIIVFSLICLTSLAITRYPMVTAKALARDFGYMFAGYFLATRVLRNRKRIIRLLEAMLVAAFLIASYGIFTQLQEGIRVYQDVAFPFFRNHCIYAGYLALVFAFALAFILGYLRYQRRATTTLLAGFVGSAIFLSFVRGAWLSLLGMFLFYAYVFRERINYRVFAVVLVLALAGIVIVSGLDLWVTFLERVETIFDTGYVANFDRLDRWLSAWEMFEDHKLLGVGYGTYGDVYEERYVYYEKAYWSGARMGAHNLYLEILAETGLVGLSAFLWLIWRLGLEVFRQLRYEYDPFRRTVLMGVAGALITFFLHAFVNNLGPSDKIYTLFWLTIGLVPVVTRLRELDEQKTNNDGTAPA